MAIDAAAAPAYGLVSLSSKTFCLIALFFMGQPFLWLETSYINMYSITILVFNIVNIPVMFYHDRFLYNMHVYAR